MSTRPALTRRALLQALAGTAAASGVLGDARFAFAQAKRPVRLVLLFTPHGAPAEHFWPKSIADLSSSAGGVSILAPLQRHAQKLQVIRGLDYVGSDNHPAIHDVYTNKTGTSVDAVVARRLGTKALRLGVVPDYAQSFTVDGQLAFDGGVPQQHVADPARAFDALVAGIAVGGTPTTPAPTGPGASDLRRLALGVTAAELDALSRRAGAHAKLDRHLAGVRALEAAAANTRPRVPIPSCTARPTLASVEKVRGKNVWAAEGFADVLAAQIDVAALALRCGLSRVVSIQCGYVNHQVPFTWAGVPDGHHNVSHSSPGAAGRVLHAKCQEWFAAQWAKLLDALDVPDPEDPGHTILDNSAVLWASEIADGQGHGCRGVPAVLAGGGGGYLKPGRLVDLGGKSHAGLLLALCEAMGVTGADMGPGATGSLAEVR